MTVCNHANTITASDGTVVPVPPEYICPLTLDVMSQPLLSREGHSYEQHAILNWVSEHGTSPLTREPLRPAQLMRNRALGTKIRLFLKQNGINPDSIADKENETKFVGYVVSTKKHQPVVQSMSLRSLTSITFHRREDIEERRRQIAELISGAMQELDAYEF
mmetsp:Transcript_10603/g.20423  ORF Transcript_10603/g.20423 Transcript_10603/m.20423 type:complete len:162 (-) Transcript_10603:85-570(-)|eukprot:scaffold923_cov171-Amphora_coffeaeformis.AAC.20